MVVRSEHQTINAFELWCWRRLLKVPWTTRGRTSQFFSFLLYNIVLVLPYITMNPPRVYTCFPSWIPSHLLPHTIPLGHPSAPAPSILYHASNLDWRFISHMILYMFQCHSPKSSHPRPLPQSPKDCSISVSLLLSCIQGYHYHLSKFHIYVLVDCILTSQS